MLRSAARKVMWVGRATVFLVGLGSTDAPMLRVDNNSSGTNATALDLHPLSYASCLAL
jgi:hypothetical protein